MTRVHVTHSISINLIYLIIIPIFSLLSNGKRLVSEQKPSFPKEDFSWSASLFHLLYFIVSAGRTGISILNSIRKDPFPPFLSCLK